MLAEYAQHAIAFGEARTLEKELRQAIGRNWSDQLVMLYGQLPDSDPDSRLKQTEKWQKAQPNNPILQLSIARLAAATGDRAKARQHFEASIAVEPTPEACAELARLLATDGDRDPAIEFFDRAIRLYQGESISDSAENVLLSDESVIESEALPPAEQAHS